MEVFAVPVEDKFILYRPLRQLAFVGNQAMAELTLDLLGDQGRPSWVDKSSGESEMTQEVVTFLQAIGFRDPDPSPPPPPNPLYRPTTAVLLLTNRCNLRCTYCYADGGGKPIQDLSLELAQTAIDRVCQNAMELGVPHFGLTFHGGGEPVQGWEILQQATAYSRGKELACRVSIVSNGVWTARQRAWLLENLDSLSISFDGGPQTQDRQRPFPSGRGSFRAVMRTIEALDQAEFSYGIRMTATAPWRGRLPEDVRFICEATGCQAMHVEPAFNTHRGQHRGPSQDESEAFVEAFMEAFEIARRAGRQLTYSGARPWLLTRTFCMAPYGALIVNASGKLVACYEVADEDHPLAGMSEIGCVSGGRVLVDDQAQSALWSYLRERRAACEGCFCFWHCAGDCYSRAHGAAIGDPQIRSPRCDMNREITTRILLWYITNSDGVWQGQGMHPQSAQLMRTF